MRCAKLSAAAEDLKAAIAARIAAEVEWADAQWHEQWTVAHSYDTAEHRRECVGASQAVARRGIPLLAAMRAEICAEQRYRSALDAARTFASWLPPRPGVIPCSCPACARAAEVSP